MATASTRARFSESSTHTLADDPSVIYQQFSIDAAHQQLTPGLTYAVVVDAFTEADATQSEIDVPLSYGGGLGTDYAQGIYVSRNGDFTMSRAENFAGDWNESNAMYDLSFRLTFSPAPPPPPPAPTIILGTSGKDLIDATHARSGQPLPGGNADHIFGFNGKDRLFGLGGGDLLDGGRGKDTLFGGDGQDLFLFSVGLRKNAPDKIMDFAPVDDTILLAMSKFKGLAQGAVSDAAFRDTVRFRAEV